MKRIPALLFLALIANIAVPAQDHDSVRRLSQVARSTGNLMLERLYLGRLAHRYGDDGSRFRLARNHLETGSYSEAIRLLTTGAPAGDVAMRREAQSLLGEAYLRSNRPEKARDIFARLLDEMPNAAQPDDAALAAVTALDLMDGRTTLTEVEHMRRAGVYQFNRDFSAARTHFEAVLARYANGSSAAEAIFQIGRGHAQVFNYTEAVNWFERVLEQHAASVVAKDALLHAASAYSRFGKSKEAITRYETFIAKFADDDRVDRAYLNIVDIYRDNGAETDALKWCSTVETKFNGKGAEAVAVFTAARIHIAREDWPAALGSLEKLRGMSDLGGPTVPGGTSAAEIAFTRGFVLEQQKRYSDAIEAYLSVPDGRLEYYGWLATQRLRALTSEPSSSQFAAHRIEGLETDLKAKDTDTRRRSALALLRFDDATDQRAQALDAFRQSVKALPAYKTPVFENKGESAADALEAIEPSWRKVAGDLPIELIPREQAAVLYPAPFVDELLKYAGSRGVDPRLMLAIMRQESRFRTDAKSFSAARGLMQFIAPTATKVANDLGRRHFSTEDIFHAPTAVLFGSHYMAGLFTKFPNQTEAVLASYNGGDENMQRWLARARSAQPERYVPEIMFAQTKDYVVRVMANYRMYQHLYDERLQLR